MGGGHLGLYLIAKSMRHSELPKICQNIKIVTRIELSLEI